MEAKQDTLKKHAASKRHVAAVEKQKKEAGDAKKVARATRTWRTLAEVAQVCVWVFGCGFECLFLLCSTYRLLLSACLRALRIGNIIIF